MSSGHVLNYSEQLVRDLSSMYLDKEYSDVSLRVEDKYGNQETLSGHMFILIARRKPFITRLLSTDVLQSLSRIEICESPTHEVNIKVNSSMAAFKTLLRFIYSGTLEFDDQIA